MINKILKSNKKYLFFLVLSTYVFLLFINTFFPTQSDDLGYKIGGFRSAISTFQNWNGRFGEMFRFCIGGWFAATPLYPVVNAFAGVFLLLLVFYLYFQKLPSKLTEISIFCIILLFIMVDPVFAFGSMFYWAAGCYNYLYSWIYIFLWLIPYVSFWRNSGNNYIESKTRIVISIISGFLAGWSTEFCIVFIVLWLFSFIYGLYKKTKFPVWYYLGLVSIFVGWVILYTCPGTNKRAATFDGYLSLMDILKSGPVGIITRLNYCFNITRAYLYYENFLLISVFIGLTVISGKLNWKSVTTALLSIALMLIPLRIIPKLFFIPIAIIICLIYAWKKKDIAKYFILIAGVLFVEFIFIGATIQVYIPKRASFQYTLMNTILIAIDMIYFFNYIKDNTIIKNLTCICCITCTILFSLFVMADAVTMNKKWKNMEASIKTQKEAGQLNVIIDKNTFISRFWSYGDWGNPTEDIHDWVNEAYSQYYGVETIISR